MCYNSQESFTCIWWARIWKIAPRKSIKYCATRSGRFAISCSRRLRLSSWILKYGSSRKMGLPNKSTTILRPCWRALDLLLKIRETSKGSWSLAELRISVTRRPTNWWKVRGRISSSALTTPRLTHSRSLSSPPSMNFLCTSYVAPPSWTQPSFFTILANDIAFLLLYPYYY